MNMSPQQGCNKLSASIVCDIRQIGIREIFHQGHMEKALCGQCSGTSDAILFRMFFRFLHQIVNRTDTGRRKNAPPHCEQRCLRYTGKILIREAAGFHLRNNGDDIGGSQADRIAVRTGFGDFKHCGNTASAGFACDKKRYSVFLLKIFSDDPRQGIRRIARPERHDQRNGTAWKISRFSTAYPARYVQNDKHDACQQFGFHTITPCFVVCRTLLPSCFSYIRHIQL